MTAGEACQRWQGVDTTGRMLQSQAVGQRFHPQGLPCNPPRPPRRRPATHIRPRPTKSSNNDMALGAGCPTQ